MATYNGEPYIAEQLRSILMQLGENDEVIVADDNSTDNTCQIIEDFNDKRIKLYHTYFRSCKWNFQYALEQAHGDIIFLSDQDDVWLENKVEKCVQALQIADLVVTDSKLTDEKLEVINSSFFTIYHSGKGIIKNSMNNTYYGSCMAFHTDLLKDALPLPKTDEIGHDIWLGLVAELTGRKVIFLDEALMLYRRHDGTRTETTDIWHRSKRSIWIKVWSRIVVLYYIIKFKYHHAR